jgi:hypothetical protein
MLPQNAEWKSYYILFMGLALLGLVTRGCPI